MTKLKPLISIVLILIITFFSFYPSIKNGFTNWDDHLYLTDNPLIKDLSFQGLAKIFSTVHMGLYKPLVFLSFALEYHFFKLNPAVYHITNLTFHLLNCMLVFMLIFMLTGSLRISFVVGLLFGIHPLHVESVAWITERKDMLYTFFILGASILYLYYLKTKTAKYYLFSLLAFILSLLAKPMAISFPIFIILFDYFLGRSYDKNTWIEKIPFFAITAVYFLAAMHTAKDVMYGPFLRYSKDVFFASYGILFYIYKLFVPVNLSCLYPLPAKYGDHLPAIFLLSPIPLIFLASVAVVSLKYNKKLMFGALFFFISILPVLQIIHTGPEIVADRYMYIASIGMFYIIAITIEWASAKLRNNMLKGVFYTLLIFAMITLSFLTRQRCAVWKNSISLWEDAVKNTSDNVLAYYNLGNAYAAIGNNQKAIDRYEKAIEINPNLPDVLTNLCNTYIAVGKNREAIESCKKAIELTPAAAKIYYNLGNAYSNIGKKEEAIKAYARTIELDGSSLEAYNNLAAIYADDGDIDKAIELWNRIIGIDPDFSTAHFNLAVFYYQQGKYDLAIIHCDRLIKTGNNIDPAFLKLLEPYRK
jgi:protein O-mannosyl-transferase